MGISSISNAFVQGTEVLEQEIYERRFLEPASIWTAYDEFSVQVGITEEMAENLFYYCLIHHGMEGQIKVLTSRTNGLEKEVDSTTTTTPTTYEDDRSDFDKKCGTYGLGDFQLPNPLCPDRFCKSFPTASTQRTVP